jgi:diamine N-acetyltransferase
MIVTLQPLTRENLWPVVELKVNPEQEKFVAPNIDSIANAYVEPSFVPLAVYAGEDLVGFAMYGQHPDTGAWWVIRLMIAPEHQGRGYGRVAMETMIEMMAERTGCEEIVTSFVPGNSVAAALYESLGFRPTGEIEDGEPLVVLRLADRRSPLAD